jgi:hypothetical protein
VTVDQMITRVGTYFTKHPTSAVIVDMLNAAQDYVYNRLRNTGVGDVFTVIDTEYTLLAAARLFDVPTTLLAGATNFVAIKQLWVKLPNETSFTRAVPMDLNDPIFGIQDNLDTANSAPQHPIKYHPYNYSFIRLNCLLPVGAVVRVDYFKRPQALAAAGNCDLPVSVHNVICDNATARLWQLMDDDRAAEWFQLSQKELSDAIYEMERRSQFPTRTLPYRRAKRRVM